VRGVISSDNSSNVSYVLKTHLVTMRLTLNLRQGFYKNWVDAFQAQGKKVYITGESYGGYYVSYVADAFINADDTNYYNLAGVAINDPILGDGDLQQEGKLPPERTISPVAYAEYADSAYCPLPGLLGKRLRPE